MFIFNGLDKKALFLTDLLNRHQLLLDGVEEIVIGRGRWVKKFTPFPRFP